MINFDNFYLLKNFIEETEKPFLDKSYDRSNKYINHLLEGFSIIVKKNIGKELNDRMLKDNPNLIVIAGKVNRKFYEENCYGQTKEV